MAKRKRKNQKKRVFILIIALFFTTVLFATSSYAWFTANKTVKVERLSVNVEAQNGIQISVDAINWKSLVQKVDILNAPNTYTDSINQVPSKMEPVSTIGELDEDGLMKMYYGTVSSDENTGEYTLSAEKDTEVRTTAAQVTEGTAQGKFIAFDLFFKVTKQSPLKLRPSSGVTSADVTDKGIKNASRIAFVILGNDTSDTSPDDLQAMGSYDGNGTDSRVVYIWEPNYDVHTGEAVQHAFSTYNYSIGTTGESRLKYYGLKNSIPVATPALLQTDMTDTNNDYKHDYGTYFDDVTINYATEAAWTCVNPTQENPCTSPDQAIFTLERGVTKVRIYIWIEGQDVDNYDFASLGKKISVEFGLTKERFFDEDFNYSNPEGAELPTDVQRNEHPAYDYQAPENQSENND